METQFDKLKEQYGLEEAKVKLSEKYPIMTRLVSEVCANYSQLEKDQIIKNAMDNFPEASAGMALWCKRYDYKKMEFAFFDQEEGGKKHEVNMDSLRKGLDAFVKVVEQGQYFNCGKPPALLSKAYDWDALDSDALVQCAIFGKVIYG